MLSRILESLEKADEVQSVLDFNLKKLGKSNLDYKDLNSLMEVFFDKYNREWSRLGSIPDEQKTSKKEIFIYRCIGYTIGEIAKTIQDNTTAKVEFGELAELAKKNTISLSIRPIDDIFRATVLGYHRTPIEGTLESRMKLQGENARWVLSGSKAKEYYRVQEKQIYFLHRNMRINKPTTPYSIFYSENFELKINSVAGQVLELIGSDATKHGVTVLNRKREVEEALRKNDELSKLEIALNQMLDSLKWPVLREEQIPQLVRTIGQKIGYR